MLSSTLNKFQDLYQAAFPDVYFLDIYLELMLLRGNKDPKGAEATTAETRPQNLHSMVWSSFGGSWVSEFQPPTYMTGLKFVHWFNHVALKKGAVARTGSWHPFRRPCTPREVEASNCAVVTQEFLTQEFQQLQREIMEYQLFWLLNPLWSKSQARKLAEEVFHCWLRPWAGVQRNLAELEASRSYNPWLQLMGSDLKSLANPVSETVIFQFSEACTWTQRILGLGPQWVLDMVCVLICIMVF